MDWVKSHGSGLGLSVCHSIVAKHDGHIDVTSREDAGTVFDIYLPAAPDAESMNEVRQVTRQEVLGRVLIMDDDESIRRAAVRILSAVGCETATATNGEEAVARFQEAMKAGNPFHVVVLDLTVPGGMGGVETLAALKAIDPNVRAIVSSGYSNDPIMASHVAHGFAAMLPKPYEPAHVREVVVRVVLSRRAN
jgi:CheY-like chemotaxis protein